MWESSSLSFTPSWPRGASSHVSTQIFLLFDRLCLWTKKTTKKPRSSLPGRGGLVSEVFRRRSSRFIQGTRLSREDWPRAPLTRRTSCIFSPRRSFALLCRVSLHVSTERKSQSIQSENPSVKSRIFSTSFHSIYIRRPPKASDLCICLLMSICNLFGFIFVHAFYLVLCIEMREVYWKK